MNECSFSKFKVKNNSRLREWIGGERKCSVKALQSVEALSGTKTTENGL
jgi:hypothetical protein